MYLSKCFDENGDIKNLDQFKYLRGNIVKKVIDKDLTSAETLKLNEIFKSYDIFEFAQSEYGEMSIASDVSGAEISAQSNTITLETYFDIVAASIDKSMLDESGLTLEDLKTTFSEYIDLSNEVSE